MSLCPTCWTKAQAPPCPDCGGQGAVYCCDDAGVRGQGATYPPASVVSAPPDFLRRVPRWNLTPRSATARPVRYAI